MSWKLIHNGEKLYARRDCCSTDQNLFQHLCFQTLPGFLLFVSSSLAITFSDFSITVVLPRPLGIWICKPNRSLLCWYHQGCNIAAIVGSQNEIPHWNASSSLHSQLLFRFQNYMSMKVEKLSRIEFSGWFFQQLTVSAGQEKWQFCVFFCFKVELLCGQTIQDRIDFFNWSWFIGSSGL